MAVLRATAPAQASRVVASRQRTASRNVAARAFRSNPRTAQPAVQEADVVGRREAIVSGLMIAATLAAAAPAEAFLGIGESTNVEQQYQDETSAILKQVRGVIELPRGDDSAEDKVKDLRKEINKWVAKYRREPKFSGKPSYGNTYSVLNALAGHFNSFGATAPIPKKRLERIVKELDDAEKLLTRNR